MSHRKSRVFWTCSDALPILEWQLTLAYCSYFVSFIRKSWITSCLYLLCKVDSLGRQKSCQTLTMGVWDRLAADWVPVTLLVCQRKKLSSLSSLWICTHCLYLSHHMCSLTIVDDMKLIMCWNETKPEFVNLAQDWDSSETLLSFNKHNFYPSWLQIHLITSRMLSALLCEQLKIQWLCMAPWPSSSVSFHVLFYPLPPPAYLFF